MQSVNVAGRYCAVSDERVKCPVEVKNLGFVDFAEVIVVVVLLALHVQFSFSFSQLKVKVALCLLQLTDQSLHLRL